MIGRRGRSDAGLGRGHAARRSDTWNRNNDDVVKVQHNRRVRDELDEQDVNAVNVRSSRVVAGVRPPLRRGVDITLGVSIGQGRAVASGPVGEEEALESELPDVGRGTAGKDVDGGAVGLAFGQGA